MIWASNSLIDLFDPFLACQELFSFSIHLDVHIENLMLFFPRKGITLPRIFCCLLFCRLLRMPFLPPVSKRRRIAYAWFCGHGDVVFDPDGRLVFNELCKYFRSLREEL